MGFLGSGNLHVDGDSLVSKGGEVGGSGDDGGNNGGDNSVGRSVHGGSDLVNRGFLGVLHGSDLGDDLLDGLLGLLDDLLSLDDLLLDDLLGNLLDDLLGLLDDLLSLLDDLLRSLLVQLSESDTH